MRRQATSADTEWLGVRDISAFSQMWSTSFHSPLVANPVGLQVYGKLAGKQKLPVIVYFHGGLFNDGQIATAETMAIALSTQAIVVCVDYPLAPAIQFPQSIEIAFAALVWVVGQADVLGADIRNLFVAGEQAGGNLAAVLAMMYRDRRPQLHKTVKLSGQMLINPMLDATQTSPSIRNLTDSACSRAWAAYIPSSNDRIHPYASPLQSCRLAGLAPAIILTHHTNPLRDEAEAYTAKLLVAGVPVQIHQLDNIANMARIAKSCQLIWHFISGLKGN